MTDGTLCQVCGAYLGEPEGYPKYCDDCKPERRGTNLYRKRARKLKKESKV